MKGTIWRGIQPLIGAGRPEMLCQPYQNSSGNSYEDVLASASLWEFPDEILAIWLAIFNLPRGP